MDNFIDVLSRVMSKSEARETVEASRQRQAEEYERHQQREDTYRRTRKINYDFDYKVYRYGQGGLRI